MRNVPKFVVEPSNNATSDTMFTTVNMYLKPGAEVAFHCSGGRKISPDLSPLKISIRIPLSFRPL